MKIKVKLYATLRHKAPKKVDIGEAFTVHLDDNSSIKDLLIKLDIPKTDTKIVMINANTVDNLKKRLNKDDLVVIFPPVGGGTSRI
ncbi:MAG: MoaD/ThiS family protein [Candidatus Hodarchaeales archaeon]|jgi:molybdopterin converting factor small subunit